ncbi:MAG: hypothetical protein NTW87_27960, partial [Planctomycetota bacterium]|nr:hypothetical protein [Planctomycetota bacterium]
MSSEIDRRDFVRQGSALGVATMLGATYAGGAEAPPTPAAKLPTIKLGTLEVSRLILGSNPFWGYAHLPGKVGEEMKAYYTDERIMAVLDEAAALGITAMASPPDQRWVQLFAKYREGGG